MPYISQEFRKKPVVLTGPGDLSYAISQVIVKYLAGEGRKNFYHMNEVVGVLASLSGEFQRRVLHPYEDKAMARNGDVFNEIIEKL